ncbi:MAG: hypothetical protein ABSB83_07540 [Methanomassiliicoccales archaeon]
MAKQKVSRKVKRKGKKIAPKDEADEVTIEDALFGKNPSRSYVLRDVWYSSLASVISEEDLPEDSKRELMFLTLSNALLDMIMDIMPEDLSVLFARNLDDYLAVTVVNQQFNVDLLQQFQDDFAAAKGTKFKDEEKLNDAVVEFEEIWWNSPRKDLGGKTPNVAVEEAAAKHNL